MSKVLATIKAVITRLVFACHGIIAIWQVTIFKGDNTYWYLASPTLLLFIEGVFTLTIKDNQEWKWFCPSVFVYLGNVVPAIWLLELHKVEKRLQARVGHLNVTISGVDLDSLSKMIGTKIQIPDIPLTTETWVTLIEQFLMLTLIVGRWLLPKGDLTRDQLSQLLLVYIGTAADIIEFFDSFKDDKIASEPLLVLLTLAIWSWSLLQFTVVLTATKSRKSRATANGSYSESGPASTCCCSIDVCAIVMNIALQDAPFLAFRLLIITHYRIVSYMNVFFTCKNTLVILLQMYRLYVVHSEMNKDKRSKAKDKSRRKDKKHHKEGRRHRGKDTRGRDVVEYGTPNVAVITDPRKMYDGETSKIRAFILTNREDLQEIELSKLFRDQATLERISEDTRRKKGKSGGKKTKHEERDSESSPTSTPNINHTTDDSGI